MIVFVMVVSGAVQGAVAGRWGPLGIRITVSDVLE
jgi:hypothetical protein